MRCKLPQDYDALCKKLKEVSALSGISGLLVRALPQAGLGRPAAGSSFIIHASSLLIVGDQMQPSTRAAAVQETKRQRGKGPRLHNLNRSLLSFLLPRQTQGWDEMVQLPPNAVDARAAQKSALAGRWCPACCALLGRCWSGAGLSVITAVWNHNLRLASSGTPIACPAALSSTQTTSLYAFQACCTRSRRRPRLGSCCSACRRPTWKPRASTSMSG